MYQTILYEVKGNVGIITLNRREKLNALTDTMLREIYAVCQDISITQEIRALVVTGSGRAFCSGADVEEASKSISRDYGQVVEEIYNPMIKKLHQLRIPVLAAINGPAVGAGLSIALACDFRMAVSTASLSPAFIHIGLVPDAGSSYFLPRIVGVSKALELSLLGQKLSADEAKQIGLVNQVVEPEQFQEATLQFATRLATLPSKAIALTKELVYRSYDSSLDEALHFEARAQSIAGKTADHQEGVNAFLQKRKPQFTGE